MSNIVSYIDSLKTDEEKQKVYDMCMLVNAELIKRVKPGKTLEYVVIQALKKIKQI